MKMKNKGFTLVELLAVIVVLGIIMTVAGMSLLGTKKDANQKEVESIYNTIKKLGPDVYLSGINADYVDGNVKVYSANKLVQEKYLKTTVNNPAKSNNICGACLIIDTSKDNMFDAYVECEGLDSVGYYNQKSDISIPDACKSDEEVTEFEVTVEFIR